MSIKKRPGKAQRRPKNVAGPAAKQPKDPIAEARRCLHSAKQFDRASRRASAGGHSDGETIDYWLPVPAVVCAAFAIELGLKTLLLIERGQRWTSHEMAPLFDALRPSTRQAIEVEAAQSSYFYREAAPNGTISEGRTRSFERALRSVNKAFEHWRYSYEMDGMILAVDGGFLQRVAAACLSVAERGLPPDAPAASSSPGGAS